VETRQLVAFQTVARTLSFTQAAAELGFAQSTVTAQIQCLEKSLRIRLFARGRQIRLTPAGERLLPFAHQILQLTHDARANVRGGGLVGRLTVGASEPITTYRLPPLVESFRHRNPEVRLSLHTYRGGPAEVLQSLRSAKADLALIHCLGRCTLRLPCLRIGTEEAVLVATPDHDRAKRRALTVAEKLDGPVLITHPGCVWTKMYESAFGPLADRPTAPLQFGTVEGVKRGVAAGLGVSLLPRIAVQDLVDTGELAILPWRPPESVATYAVWAEAQTDSPARRMFVYLATRAALEAPATTEVEGSAGLMSA
jgi:DNA-binding transcriptional LysR family regulator